jgi:hypothetical protein
MSRNERAPPRFVCAALDIQHYSNNPKSSLAVDLCMSVITFGEEAQLGGEKISMLFALVHAIFQHAFDSHDCVTREDSLDFFRQQVARCIKHAFLSPFPLDRKMMHT